LEQQKEQIGLLLDIEGCLTLFCGSGSPVSWGWYLDVLLYLWFYESTAYLHLVLFFIMCFISFRSAYDSLSTLCFLLHLCSLSLAVFRISTKYSVLLQMFYALK
jgi:hypothetical protein